MIPYTTRKRTGGARLWDTDYADWNPRNPCNPWL